jgi:hypothetical protein
MKMRRIVIVPVHPDNYAIEAANTRHDRFVLNKNQRQDC